MPELDWIEVAGFTSIAATKVELRPINVLIGPNGSGKSNFIRAFQLLHEIRGGRLQAAVARAGGADRLLHFGAKTTGELRLALSFGEGVNGYEIVLTPTAGDRLTPQRESVFYWDRSKFLRPFDEPLFPRGDEAGISDETKQKIARYVRERLDSWRLYHFHDTGPSSPLKLTSQIDDNRFLRPDGANIASFLNLLHVQHHDHYQLIRRSVQRVAPFFDDFQLEPLRLNPSTIRLEWRHVGSDAYFDATSLSDGTLRFIALATLLLQPDEMRPSVILIDEPELGLHPAAVTLLAALIRQASTTTQVIVSTQSPQLLDHFQPEDVLVAERVDGGTRLSRLDAERLAAWLEDYTLGQLWQKNEIGGRPAPDLRHA